MLLTLNVDTSVKVKDRISGVPERAIGMRIRAFAARTGLSRRQVRYATDLGLLTALRLPNGYRDYDPHDIARAQRIGVLFAAGLTAEQVRELSPCLSSQATMYCDATQRALAQRLFEFDAQIEQLSSARALITKRLEQASLQSVITNF